MAKYLAHSISTRDSNVSQRAKYIDMLFLLYLQISKTNSDFLKVSHMFDIQMHFEVIYTELFK